MITGRHLTFLMRLLHLYKRLCPSVGPLVGLWVSPLMCGLVHNTFVKIAKSIEKSSVFFAVLFKHPFIGLSVYLSLFLSIILSI